MGSTWVGEKFTAIDNGGKASQHPVGISMNSIHPHRIDLCTGIQSASCHLSEDRDTDRIAVSSGVLQDAGDRPLFFKEDDIHPGRIRETGVEAALILAGDKETQSQSLHADIAMSLLASIAPTDSSAHCERDFSILNRGFRQKTAPLLTSSFHSLLLFYGVQRQLLADCQLAEQLRPIRDSTPLAATRSSSGTTWISPWEACLNNF
ncbi:hypothetical protein EYF80_012237 [Liparis tanakae]|uniref:Uncharacterized protein n=1 Tax=Liparis tanakae TaxID=230148 RepID=A0A4Z2IIM5_9TELE|nr:hypothetical protein EYF80_012237 [Liparis tanakae]